MEVQVWDHVNNLYEKSVSFSKEFNKYFDYYCGRFTNLSTNSAQKLENACNVIKQIVDTKASLALDNYITTTVLPKLGSFQDLTTIKEFRAEADIYNDALKNALKDNIIEKLKQKFMKWGCITGMGISEVLFDPNKGKFGDINITSIDPRMVKWDKSAKTIQDAGYFSVDMELSIYDLKKKYATNADGTIDEEMSHKIDTLAEIIPQKKEGRNKGIVSYQNDAGAGQGFVKEEEGIKFTGKMVKLTKMYLKDSSTFVPDKDDKGDDETKEFLRFAYPNGRCIVFVPDKKSKIILEDKALDADFGYPIDIFNPSELESLEGKGEAEDLIYIQDRIAMSYEKIRILIGNFISSVCVDKSQEIEFDQNSWVNNPVQFVENLDKMMPQVLTNNTINEIKTLWEHINLLKQNAYEVARVNPTMISGQRQKGTTSAAQVEALAEDPQSSIRSIQRQFRDFMISMSNKVVKLIQKYYDFNKLIMLTTGISTPEGQEAVYANINQGEITLYDEAAQAIQKIKQNPEMEFTVDIVAGTEIPRSRQETAMLMDKLMAAGMLGNPQDIAVKEEYMRALDVPNYRTFIKIARDTQEQTSQIPALPPADKIGLSFDKLPIFAQMQWLKQNGWDIPSEIPENVEQISENIGQINEQIM